LDGLGYEEKQFSQMVLGEMVFSKNLYIHMLATGLPITTPLHRAGIEGISYSFPG